MPDIQGRFVEKDWGVIPALPELTEEFRKQDQEMSASSVESSSIWVPSSRATDLVRLQIAPAPNVHQYFGPGLGGTDKFLQINAWSPLWTRDNDPDNAIMTMSFIDDSAGDTQWAVTVAFRSADGSPDFNDAATLSVASSGVLILHNSGTVAFLEHPSLNMMQITGFHRARDLLVPGTGTITGNGTPTKTLAVSFAQAFAAAPHVIVGSGNVDLVMAATSVTASGFTLNAGHRNNSNWSSAEPYWFVAINVNA